MLSEKLIQEIEKATGLAGLQGMIESPELVDAELIKTKHFTEGEHRTLVTNLTSEVPQEKWEEAKVVGIEKAIKKLKEEKGLDFQGKSPEDLYNFMHKQIEFSKEADNEKLEAEYKQRLSAYEKKLQEKDSEINQMILKSKQSRINSLIDNHFNSLQIEAPAHLKDEKQISEYIKLEKEKNKAFFKNQYEFDIDEYDNIIAKKGGEILKDNTLNPIRVDNLVQDYVKSSFIPIKQSIQGRGEGDRLPSRDMTKFKSVNEVIEHYKAKGVKPNTSEMDAIIMEYNKTNK